MGHGKELAQGEAANLRTDIDPHESADVIADGEGLGILERGSHLALLRGLVNANRRDKRVLARVDDVRDRHTDLCLLLANRFVNGLGARPAREEVVCH